MFSSKDLFFTPAASGAYTVSKSLRFRSSASAYLSRTPASASDQKKWTFSAWVKRGQLGATQIIAQAGTGGTNFTYIALFNSSDQLVVLDSTVSGVSSARTTTAVFRDPSSWYHIVVYLDAANSTSKVYVNGVEQTCTGTQPSNQNWAVNSAIEHRIGRAWGGNTNYLDGYIAEVNFIDGQALTPSSFGAYDTNGIWQPAAYTGSYGTNGFYLKFTTVGATSGSNTGYGQDFSGNGNYWTTNNFGTTSTATTYDSMLDSPTNATGDIGNYCVFNPLDAVHTGSANSISSGNLEASGIASVANLQARGGMAMPSGKYYAEFSLNVINYSQYTLFGIVPANDPATGGGLYNQSTNVSYFANGNKRVLGTNSAYGASWVANDIIGIAVDVDNTSVTFYKNGVSQGAITSSSFFAQGPCLFAVTSDDTGSPKCFANFGQRPFAYTPPSGYSALNTQNLTTPTITNGAQYMAATTYTGNGSSGRNITNGGNNNAGTTFAPDLVWVKIRSSADNHRLADTVRGANKSLSSNLTDAESSLTTVITGFNADGFTIGTDGSVNTNTSTYVGWQWKGGGTGVSNTSGSITSTVSANTSAGFSVVTYTGTGANATVGHGLGVTPALIFGHSRSRSGERWPVWNSVLTTDNCLELNSTAAVFTASTIFRTSAMSSTVIGIGGNASVNANTDTYVMYCFAPVAGYSAFGSYTGNGSSDGPFIFTGFRPRWLMVKNTSTAATDWFIVDSSINTYNVVSALLVPNSSGAEVSSLTICDFLSNGFKFRDTNSSRNASGSTYIYAAFAENPFKISRAR